MSLKTAEELQLKIANIIKGYKSPDIFYAFSSIIAAIIVGSTPKKEKQTQSLGMFVKAVEGFMQCMNEPEKQEGKTLH